MVMAILTVSTLQFALCACFTSYGHSNNPLSRSGVCQFLFGEVITGSLAVARSISTGERGSVTVMTISMNTKYPFDQPVLQRSRILFVFFRLST